MAAATSCLRPGRRSRRPPVAGTGARPVPRPVARPVARPIPARVPRPPGALRPPRAVACSRYPLVCLFTTQTNTGSRRCSRSGLRSRYVPPAGIRMTGRQRGSESGPSYLGDAVTGDLRDAARVLTDEANLRRLAIANAGGRVAIGIAFLLTPHALGGRWFGEEATPSCGGRPHPHAGGADLVLGVGMLRALSRGEPVRPWFALAVGVETVDGVAALVARKHLPKWTVVATVVLASAGALSDALLARHLDQ